ncbi:MAG: GspE/PulE family protein [Candidatus Hydrogenedentota bacterium]
MSERRLGDILLENDVITDLQLAEGLQVQKEEKKRIGDVLVDLKIIDRNRLRDVITEFKKRIPLGDYLLEKGLISQDDLEYALRLQKRTGLILGQILIESEFISAEDLAKGLSEQLDMPFIVPYQRLVDTRLFEMLPTHFMRNHNLLPLRKSNRMVTILVQGPPDETTYNELVRVFGPNIDLAIAPASKIHETLDALMGQTSSKDAPELTIVSAEEGMNIEDFGRSDMGGGSLKTEGIEAESVKLVNYLISDALQAGASDVHLEPLPDRIQVRYRVDGSLIERMDIPLDYLSSMVRRIKVLANLKVTDARSNQSGRLVGHIDDVKVDLRVSIMVGIHGESLSLRFFPQESGLMEISDLGLTPNAQMMIHRALDYSAGLMVFAGPPSSGKTTTMFAALKHLVDKRLKIVTIEDPVEHILPGALQTHLSANKDNTIDSLIQTALHQDPDVIALGEIPHGDDASKFLKAAMTGHKVLTSVYADDTIGTLLRLADAGVDVLLKSSTTITVICQRLVRRLCQNCLTPVIPDATEAGVIPIKDFDPDKYDFFEGSGCDQCNNTGFVGRTGLFEVLSVNGDVRDALLRGATSSEVLLAARRTSPLLAIAELGVLKVIRKETTLDELLRVTPIISGEHDMRHFLTLPDIERISEHTGFGE